MIQFTTHTGQTVTGSALQEALDKVASDLQRIAESIYKENAYADHVPEVVKLQNLKNGLELADRVKSGTIDSFTVWQRINTELTGKCIALLP